MLDKKWIRSLFCCMVAAMLLVVSMGSRAIPTADDLSAGVSLNQVDHQDCGDTQSNPTEQTTVSALSLDAVVISLFSYHFSQYFLPTQPLSARFATTLRVVTPARFSEPLFFFCYFQKVFGNQIASNAP